MRTERLRDAQTKVLALLADGQPHEPLEVIAQLDAEFGRSITRAAILDLIESARVRWTPQRYIQRPIDQAAAHL